MKIKIKKLLSLVLAILILLSNSPISLATVEEPLDESVNEVESVIKEDTKKDSLEENESNLENSEVPKNSEVPIEENTTNSTEENKDIATTYSYENDDIKITIDLKEETLNEEVDLVVKEISEKDQLDKYINNKVNEKLHEDQKLKKMKAYDIYFVDKDGNRVDNLETQDIHYSFKKPFLLDEKNDLLAYSLFNNDLLDPRNTEIKRNDKNEVVEISFEVNTIEKLILADIENVNTKEDTETKKEDNKKFTLNYSEDEKKLISKFEKLIKDESEKTPISDEEVLDLKDKLDIKNDDKKYIDISNIEVKDGHFLVKFKQNSKNKIEKIKVELSKGLILEEEIYSKEEIESIKDILKNLKDLEKSVEKLNSSKDSNNLEIKKLNDKKQKLIEDLTKIKTSYSLKDQGLEKEDLSEGSYFLTLKNPNDFTLAFRPINKEINSEDLLKISVDGDLGEQVIILKNKDFEKNNIDGLFFRNYALLSNSPSNNGKEPNLEKHKTIDYLGDGVENPDTDIKEEMSDKYRIYLDLSSETQAEKEGIDLVIAVDRSYSMNEDDMIIRYKYETIYIHGRPHRIPVPIKETRYQAIDSFLNGDNGFINTFLNQNPKNNISVVDFGGIIGGDGNHDASILQDWTNKSVGVPINRPNVEGTNYDAGLILAKEQFDKRVKQGSKNSKVLIFLSDGVPTFYIDSNGKRQGDGKTGQNVDIVKKVMIDTNIPKFHEENPDINMITVGVGGDFEKGYSPDVLRSMADLSGGSFLSVKEDVSELTKGLANEVLYAVKNVEVTDTLSDYVEFDKKPDFKVTVTDKNNNVQTLWENGKETSFNKNIKGGYIKNLETENNKVKLIFNPSYQLDKNLKFTLSYNVKVSDKAYDEFQEKGYPHKGDENTDYGSNATSSKKAGFYSNDSAYVKYKFGPEEKEYSEDYHHPVVQVKLQDLDIKKVDPENRPLEGAKFSIYKEENSDKALSLYEDKDLNEKISEFTSDDKGEIKVYGLVRGTYYLKEINAPKGFNKIEKALELTVSQLGEVSIKEADKSFSLDNNTIKVENEPEGGVELPTTGGSGTLIFRLVGLLVLAIALIIPFRKRLVNEKNK